MKKVLAYDKSGISKEQDVKETYNEKTAGGFFKYKSWSSTRMCWITWSLVQRQLP